MSDSTLYIIAGTGNGGDLLGHRDVWSSTDGVNWVQRTSTETRRARMASAVLNGTIYVMGGVTNFSSRISDVRSSADGGVTWSETASAAFSAGSDSASVVFNERIYMLGGFDGSYLDEVWSSADGATWTQH